MPNPMLIRTFLAEIVDKIPDVYRDTYVTRATVILNLTSMRAKPTRICMSYYSHFDDFSNNPEGNPTIARKVAS